MDGDWARVVSADRDGVVVRIRVQPRSSRPGPDGLVEQPDGPALRLRLAAPPAEGRANAEAVASVAALLGVPRRAVTLAGGAASRTKRLRVSGLSVAEAVSRLAAGAGGDS